MFSSSNATTEVKEHTIVLDSIKKFIEEGEMSFLIGAGFSRNVNKKAYLLWGELLKDAAWKLFGDGTKGSKAKKQEVLEKAEKEMGYLGLASSLVKKSGYHEAIDTYIESKTPYLKTIEGKQILLLNGIRLKDTVSPDCHNLLKQLDIQNIYTFNYDNALEFFMGEEARQNLEQEIKKCEGRLAELQKEKDKLESKGKEIQNQLDQEKLSEETDNKTALSGNEAEGDKDSGKSQEQLDNVRKETVKNEAQESEIKIKLETLKQNRRSFYNVVKDSYDISLSSKRKSIYKIHGSLRESSEAEYGFDGDTHTQYIITQEDYDTYNEKHGAFVNMMRIDLLRSRFCIVGVSGGDANFLAWINWVKDVLDKTKDRDKKDGEEQHQSYFIYSGSTDMPVDLELMLKNHFIQPVILKEIFPKTNTDEERIKMFLEYIQPLNNNGADEYTDSWSGIEVPRRINKVVKLVSSQTADDLLRLSSKYRFNKPQSAIHYRAKNVQFAANYYLREDATEPERKVYAAAVNSTLMPVDLSCNGKECERMDNEANKEIRPVFQNALRRVVLLQNLMQDNGAFIREDAYIHILSRLFNYDFPTGKEVEEIGSQRGLDFVRRYSLLHLLGNQSKQDKCEAADFQSPQELVLATDCLKYIGYKNSTLYRTAEECKHQFKLFSLYDYCQSYLEAMRRKEELSTYGNVSGTIYMDTFTSDVTNGAVLLNSIIELGICFAGHSALSDTEWVELVKALKTRYGVPLVFYTIVRNGKDKVIKLVAQEMMYDEKSRKVLPDILKNIINSILSESTPNHLKSKMAQFATEILPAVDVKHWSRLFVAKAEIMINLADKYNVYLDATKSLYGFVSSALEYIGAKSLKLRLIKRVLNRDNVDDRFDSIYNHLVISARVGLKPADFVPLVNELTGFAKRVKEANSQQGYFIIMNLLLLIKKDRKPELLELIKERCLKAPYMTEGYAAHVKDFPEMANAFKDEFLKGDDLWHTGISGDGISIGAGNVSVSQMDNTLHFDERQTLVVYDNLKKVLGKINKVLQRDGRQKEDKGWMSSENNFREIVMDMRLFVHQHQEQLSEKEDYEQTYKLLVDVYEQCFFRKDVYQLLADDEIYRAVRRIMVETELYGIESKRQEYEQLIGRIMAKNTTELNTAFRHVSWAMGYYKKMFDTEEFNELFKAVLNVYEPYFNASDGEQLAWDLMGCQKEIAEKSLTAIAKTLEERGYKDEFWGGYQKVFQVR